MTLLARTFSTLLAGLVLASSAFAQIRDDAKLFKPETLLEAEKRLKKIQGMTREMPILQGQHGPQEKSVAVWTMKEAPPERIKDINTRDLGQLQKTFDEMAHEHIKELKLEGVHLLICQEPLHIEITVTKDSQFLFGNWYRDQLKQRMISRFQLDNPDQHVIQMAFNKLRSPNPNKGLIEALDYIALKFDYNRPIDHTNFKLGGVAIGGVLGFGAILGVMRSRLRATTPADSGVHDAEGSGRSIAVLGGGIGAVTGQWIYNRLFGPSPVEEPPVSEESHATEELSLPESPPDEITHGEV